MAPRSNPLVSVIVPVYNGSDEISTCLEALLNQSYPEESYEVVVVDNGSTDDTATVIDKYPVTLLHEMEIQGSYATRNTGIENARGEILAFTDADCIPVHDWIERGVEALRSADADLAGGNVSFEYSSPPTAAEQFDSVTNMQIQRAIESRGVAKTANLFVRESVFESIGSFPEERKSGGDVEWTGRATGAGFKLVYAPDAEVCHPARRFIPLMKKQFRVGKGQIQVWREGKQTSWKILRNLIRGLLPLLPSTIAQRLRYNGIEYDYRRLIRIWLVAWAFILAANSGRISKLLEDAIRP